ncbi:CHAD domain-containing protein [Nitratiruptor tergarcus]|uniref:CHAD domain-containing protein n=1 Tax=Nitratiruptor tergarcus DSM 16512 TaxID=1069081 RepID=A0A1W1WR72_9BACT|nr:CHAD domain-containing protein [Nitratiruptor tergarcus]SMC08702.1 CHAD domain-containing protein [Nitratiruptor tergarcus DSM 16512]
MESKEIERKYLLPPCNPKKLLKSLHIPYKKSKIVQFYTQDHKRYRQKDNSFYKTIKKGEGVERVEIENIISQKEFAKAFIYAQGAIIHKIRYFATIDGQVYEFDWFEGELKGLAFVEIEFSNLEEAIEFSPPPQISRIILDEVTEDPNFTNAVIALHGIPLKQIELLQLLADAQKAVQGKPQAKIELVFHPYYDVLYLLKASIYALLHVVLHNKEAILAGDKDSERLHQLRVAMRKMRSYLSLFSHIHPIPKDLEKKLSSLMKQTNRARDIDIALLWIEEFKKKLPEKLKSNLDAIQESLKEQKQSIEEQLKEFLQTKEFEEAITQLKKFCHKDEIAHFPAIIAAKKIINKQLKKLKKMSNKLSKKSDPKDFHKVRIEAKKLRYLLELFSSLLEPESFTKALDLTKELQTILGEHQDFEVQIEYLRKLQQTQENEAILFLIQFLEKKAKKRRKTFLKKRKKLKVLRKNFQCALCRFC